MYLKKESTVLNENGSLGLTLCKPIGLTVAWISSWKDGLKLSIEKGKRSDLRILDFEATLLNRSHRNDESLPIHTFIEQIPDNYVKAAEQYVYMQYQVLRIFRHSAWAYDLFKSNRLLFDLLIYHHQSLRKSVRLLKLPQHDILRSLYTDNQSLLSYKTVVRMLKERILIDDEYQSTISIDEFLTRLFSATLPCTNQRALFHIKHIPIQTLKKEYLAYTFRLRHGVLFNPLQEIMDEIDQSDAVEIIRAHRRVRDHVARTYTLIKDILSMASRLPRDEDAFVRRLFKVNSHKTLVQLHDKLMTQLAIVATGTQPAINPDRYLGEPPIPGTRMITPLTHYRDLVMEGETMRHCVGMAGYANDVLKGRSYIYAVNTAVDRCTLELGINNGNQYSIRQLRTYRNRDPAPETVERVKYWLSRFINSRDA